MTRVVAATGGCRRLCVFVTCGSRYKDGAMGAIERCAKLLQVCPARPLLEPRLSP